MKAWVFGGMLVLCASVAACSSSGGDAAGGGTGEGGSTGEGGGGDGGSTTGSPTGQTATGTTTGGSPTSATTTTGGGGDCLGGEAFLNDPTCDACVQDQCCAEIEACIADFQAGGTDCVLEDGSFNPDGTLSNAFFTCAENNCPDECGTGEVAGVCDSGIVYLEQDGQTPDDALNACLGDACCDEFNACTQNAADVQGCIDCLQAGGTGELCSAAAACAEESGCFSDICDTGLSFGSEEADTCFETGMCCEELDTCLGAGDDACVACINAYLDGGAAEPACADFVACGEEGGCFGE